MAISKEEIKKLADLARIEINDWEQEKLAGEMDAVLDYVGQIKSVTGTEAEDKNTKIEELHNVMREDIEPNKSGVFTDDVVREFPNKENNYLKVKKIL